ncbi:MAG: hypothetical protein FD189_2577, partial [Elusimicrobia bacterium]
WAEMKKYLKDGDATATAYEDFAPHMREIYKPPDLARASLISLTRTKQFPDETVTQFRSRLERLAGKAYRHLRVKDREPLAISLFASGLLDFGLAEHVLTLAPQTLSEAERIALECLQIRRVISSVRPRIRRNDPVPFLRGHSQPTGVTPLVDPDQESELASPDSFRIDAGDDDDTTMPSQLPAPLPVDPQAGRAPPLAIPLAALPLA